MLMHRHQSSSTPPPTVVWTSWGTLAPPARIPNLKVRAIVDDISPATAAAPATRPGHQQPAVSRFSSSTAPSIASENPSPPTKNANGYPTPSKSASAGTGKKPGIFRFLSVKEPSTAAFVEYAEQQKKAGALKPVRPVAPSPGFSKQRMPDFVPKVNSKWDGMPAVAHNASRIPEWKKSSDALRRTKSAHVHSHSNSTSAASRTESRNVSAHTTSLPSRSGTARSSVDSRRRGHERPNGHLNLVVPVQDLPPLPDPSVRKQLVAQNSVSERRKAPRDAQSEQRHTQTEQRPDSAETIKEFKPSAGDTERAEPLVSPSHRHETNTQPLQSLDDGEKARHSPPTKPSAPVLRPASTAHSGVDEITPVEDHSKVKIIPPAPQAPTHDIQRSPPTSPIRPAPPPKTLSEIGHKASRSQESTFAGQQDQWPLPPGAKAVRGGVAKIRTEPPPVLANHTTSGAAEAPRPVSRPPDTNGGRASVPVPRNFARPQMVNASPKSHDQPALSRPAPRNFARPFAPPANVKATPAASAPAVTVAEPASVAGPALNRGLRPPAAAIGRPITKDTALEPIIEVDGASMISVPMDKDTDASSHGRRTPSARYSGAGQTFWNGDDTDDESTHQATAGTEAQGDEVSMAESDVSASSAMSDQWYRSPKERLGLGGMITHDRESSEWPAEMARAESELLAELAKSGATSVGRKSGEEGRQSRGSRGSLGSMFRRSER